MSRKYKGVNIFPAEYNNVGLRWEAQLKTGRVRADTLDGIKEMITDAINGNLSGASAHLNYSPADRD